MSTQTNPPVTDADAAQVDELAPIYAAAVHSLQTGFRLGAAVLLVGLVWAAIADESLGREVDAFADILPSIRDGRARGLIDLAILCFMATPVATVVVVTRGFFKISDRTFTLLSSVVLAVLVASIAVSLIK